MILNTNAKTRRIISNPELSLPKVSIRGCTTKLAVKKINKAFVLIPSKITQKKTDHLALHKANKSTVTKSITLQQTSLDTYHNKLEEYDIGSQIGFGAYGIVKAGIHRRTGKRVAMKVYEKTLCYKKRTCVDNEIDVLDRLKHPNIIRLYEVIDTPRYLYLVIELAKGKSLFSYTRSLHGKKMSEATSIAIFKQILSAIQYCHSKNIIHRDIKQENIIIDENFNVKLIDFGFATRATETQKLKTYCGTPEYMAPELINNQEYNGRAVDMWSLGVLLYIMLCGSYPFTGKDEEQLYEQIGKGLFSVPMFVSGLGRNLICRLLEVNPEQRFTAEQAACDLFLNPK